VEHAHLIRPGFPWRAATVVVGVVALVELVALIAVALVHVAGTTHHAASTPAASVRHAAALPVPTVRNVPLRPRSRVRVLVLNGNGVAGAAAASAARLRADGYRIGGAANAQRHDYARSMVLYVPGWAKEAHRLARDAGIGVVAPEDGLRPAQLRGSRLILLLGR
jgi:hypothetical protein